MIKEINTCLDVGEDELLKLAVCLRNNADDKRIWDADVELIESDMVPNKELIDEFLDNRKNYEASISRKKIMGQTCIVSKKITREGCKVGYMLREEPQNERDSGWWFASGTEDYEYVNNTDNLELCIVNSINGLDPVNIKYIDSPVGTSLVRKTEEEFEKDNE